METHIYKIFPRREEKAMKVKFNNKIGIRRITACAAFLSATGAWLIINNHTALGLSTFATTLIIGYNALAFILLYSIFGPRKTHANKSFVISQRHLLPMIDLRVQLRSLQKNLSDKKVSLTEIDRLLKNEHSSKPNLKIYSETNKFLNSTNEMTAKISKLAVSTQEVLLQSQKHSVQTKDETLNLIQDIQRIVESQSNDFNTLKNTSHAYKTEVGDYSVKIAALVQSAQDLKSTSTALQSVMSDLKLEILRAKIRISNGKKELDFTQQIENFRQIIRASEDLISANVDELEAFGKDFQSLSSIETNHGFQANSDFISQCNFATGKLANMSESHFTEINAISATISTHLQASSATLAAISKDVGPLRAEITASEKFLKQYTGLIDAQRTDASNSLADLSSDFSQTIVDLEKHILQINLDQIPTHSSALNDCDDKNDGGTKHNKPNRVIKMPFLKAKSIFKPKLDKSKSIVAQGLSKIEDFSKQLDAPASNTATINQPSLDPSLEISTQVTKEDKPPEINISFEANGLKDEPILIFNKEPIN